MKSIDNKGLMLCDLQAQLFEESTKLGCSSEIFVRRFMNSSVVDTFDNAGILDDSLTIDDMFFYINEEYGDSNYGSVKYSDDELYWIGYIYRYMSYTYEMSSKRVYNIIKPKELRSLFRAYHTFDTSYAIERIFEAKDMNLKEDYVDKGLEALRKMNNIMTYKMDVNKDFLYLVKQTKKVVLSYDKWQSIKKGDVIIFKENINKEKFKVVDFDEYRNCYELISSYKEYFKDCSYFNGNFSEDEKVLLIEVKLL